MKSFFRVLPYHLACLSIVWLLGPPLEARSCRVNLIPHGSRFSCANCHVNPRGGGSRTPFGEAVRPLVGRSCNPFWSPALAALDSDGDGRTNGEELLDPLGTWTPGRPAPGDRTDVSNPGVRDAPPAAVFLRGDANVDGALNISDGIHVVRVLLGSKAPVDCRAAADVDDDGRLDLTDAVYLLQYLFSRGPPPSAPFPGCGPHPSPLPCTSQLACK